MEDKGKIYLLMGYLGSGKTTFIRNLLTNKQGVKYAVIQNQFAQGEMGIQQPLIMDESGVPFSNFLELPNGCICCSAKNDLVASVEYILNNTDVKNVIVETNGLADPAESIKQFWFDQQMNINAELHSIISIISVPRYQSLKNEALFHKQISYSNKILLTFIDKSSPQQIQKVQTIAQEINPNCTIQRNDKYDIIGFLSGSSMFDIQNLKPHGHKSQHNHEGIQSVFIRGTVKTCKNSKQFECKVGELLWESEFGPNIMRIKGAISLLAQDSSQNSMIYELQGIKRVEDIFEIKETKTACQKLDNETRILIIGKNLNKQKIKQILGIEEKEML